MDLTVSEAARRTGGSVVTIRHWIWSGRLPSRKIGNQRLVAAADLDALVGAVGPPEEPGSGAGLQGDRASPDRETPAEGLLSRAWEIAGRMGGARTYDAEYCALAELLGCYLVTGDRRLRSAGAWLGYVLTVEEAAARCGMTRRGSGAYESGCMKG